MRSLRRRKEKKSEVKDSDEEELEEEESEKRARRGVRRGTIRSKHCMFASISNEIASEVLLSITTNIQECCSERFVKFPSLFRKVNCGMIQHKLPPTLSLCPSLTHSWLRLGTQSAHIRYMYHFLQCSCHIE